MSSTTVSTDKLLADLKTLADDVENLVRGTAGLAGEGVASLRQRIERSLESGKETVAENQRALKERSRQAAQEASYYAHEKPWSVFGVALGIAVVVGLLCWSQSAR